METHTESNNNSLWRGALSVILLVTLIAGVYIIVRQKRFAPKLRVEMEHNMIIQGVPQKLKALYDPDGAGATPEQDVTENVQWSTDNSSVAYIGNSLPTKGNLIVPKQGNATISVGYQNLSINVPIAVQAAPLEINCYPIGQDTVRAGRGADYIVYFSKIGLPDYDYEWTAPENQSSTLTVPYFSFNTSGEKVVKVVVTDRAGTKVAADCKPLTVKK